MRFTRLALVAAATCIATGALASSHREAPFITQMPKVDNTDVYLFRSYEANRANYTTLIANFQPFQDSYGGPNYFYMDPNALYEIHVDNNGDSREDLTFQFRFTNTFNPAVLNIGGNMVAIPLIVSGAVGTNGNANDTGNLGVKETYSVTVVRGLRRGTSSTRTLATNLGPASAAPTTSTATTFMKPVDNIGNKTLSAYNNYADAHIFNIGIPGCSTPGKVFVGQRKEGFVVNLGEVFDLVNLNPLGPRNGRSNTIGNKNITSLALEVPTTCLTNGTEKVIGAWASASVRQARLINANPTSPATANREGGAWTQVSRLSHPLINEVVIGLTDKDRFNATEPYNDVANFGKYVLYPTLPALVQALYNVPAPSTPRSDFVSVFVTGIQTQVSNAILTGSSTATGSSTVDFTHPAGINLSTLAGAGEMVRMNTAFPATVTAAANQSDLGFLGCDLAGFPNGRRPFDDVADIELTVAEGALTSANPNTLQTCDLSGTTPTVKNSGRVVNDGAQPVAGNYLTRFPYLNFPLPGSPNSAALTTYTTGT